MGRVVEIWTDGSGNNPGSVGWAAVLTRRGRNSRLVGGFAKESTVNRAETSAVILALLTLKRPSKVIIYTDSQYVVNGIRRLKRKSILKTNQDLWKILSPLLKKHQVTVEWVRGHADDKMNHVVDALAGYAWREQTNIDEYVDDVTTLYDKPVKAVSNLLKKRVEEHNDTVRPHTFRTNGSNS